jgi:hypothetical protein
MNRNVGGVLGAAALMTGSAQTGGGATFTAQNTRIAIRKRMTLV